MERSVDFAFRKGIWQSGFVPFRVAVNWVTVAQTMMKVALALAFRPGQEGINTIRHLVRARFPSVPQISTTELASWRADSGRPQPLLLDVRSQEEFDVSHLSGAQCIDDGTGLAMVKAKLPKDAAIVVYCSVGYRSSDLAAKLINAGFSKVQNLEGSIFQWANEGRALEAKGNPVAEVHPYHPWFRRLLAPSDINRTQRG